MGKDDAWPSCQDLRSPFNHNKKAAVVNQQLQPPVSQSVINQIACHMGSSQSPAEPSQPLGVRCQELLAVMPDFPKMESPQLAKNNSDIDSKENSELNKLLKSGYKILEKDNGEWSETDLIGVSDNKKLLLE